MKHRSVCLVALFSLIVCVSLLAGCASLQPEAKYETDLLSKHGASIEVGNVTAEEGKVFEADAVGMLREALDRELEHRQIRWAGDASAERFILKAMIINYEMGNAFKRWLLPGYGSTILEVKCDLVSGRDGSLAATLHHKRGVYMGGAFTIGAWKGIFDSVAADIANELETRLKGKGFVVSAEPWSAKDIKIEPARTQLKIKVLPLEDQRPEKGRIGERFAAFNVSMGNVYLSRDVSGFLSETISDDLRAAGHSIQDTGQDVTVSGSVLKFWIGTKTTLFYWDIVGETELKLAAKSSQPDSTSRERLYTVRQVKRTYVWPTQTLFNEVLNACMEELMQKIRSERLWAQED